MNSVCLYGGSFDPVHIAHLILAESAREILNIPKITFLPAPSPPHKSHVTPFALRLKMLNLALEGNPSFDISSIEEERGGISYTINTVRYFLEIQGCDEVYLLIGADSLLELSTWRDWRDLLTLAKVVVMVRSECDLASIDGEIVSSVRIIGTPRVDVSATDIRERVKKGKSIRYLVPDAVREFVLRKNLYI